MRLAKMKFFGLLHLAEDEKSAMNVSARNFENQISIYVNNALTLSKTLQKQGIDYTLLTNRKNTLENYLKNSDHNSLQIVEILFPTKVPSGIKFYSAHFKIDVFRYFSKLEENYIGLCDLDMICINKLPNSMKHLVKSKTPLCYDVSDQVIPAYGSDIIIRDLHRIHNHESEGRWTGGEFIAGSPSFFKTLIDEIDALYDNYIRNIDALHHVSDEALTSAALELIRKRMYIADVGTLGIVGRFWSIKTRHPQKSIDYFEQCFLLHLPADKKFLSKMALKNIGTSSELMMNYKKHINSLSERIRRLRHFILRILPARFSLWS